MIKRGPIITVGPRHRENMNVRCEATCRVSFEWNNVGAQCNRSEHAWKTKR